MSRRQFRRGLSAWASALVVALVLGGGLTPAAAVAGPTGDRGTATPAPAAPIAAAVCDNDHPSEYPGTDSRPNECIAGAVLPSIRGRLAASCLTMRPDKGAVYAEKSGACGGRRTLDEAEYIGQARAIAWVNKDRERQASGVSPNLQWEFTIVGRQRADILWYDRKNIEVPIQVIEAKGDWNRDAGKVLSQVTGYQQAIANKTGRPTQLGTVFAGYTDHYRIQLAPCAGSSTPRFDDYNVSSPLAGLLWIKKTWAQNCPGVPPRGRPRTDWNDIELPQVVDAEPEEDPARVPTTVPEDVLTRPAPAPDPELVGSGVDLSNAVCKWFVCPAVDGLELAWDGISTGGAATWDWLKDPTWIEQWKIFFENEFHSVSWGDPHYATLDGLHYDLQAAGEFHLVRSPSMNLDVQARLVPSTDSVSQTERIAFDLNGFEVELARDGTILVDGAARPLAHGQYLYTGNGSALVRADDQFGRTSLIAIWPGETARPILWYIPSLERIATYVPKGTPDVSGLLGNADGQWQNDLRLSDGTQLPHTTGAAAIHGAYADSWRITDAESRFTYAPGKSTASYTDRTFPARVITVADLAPEDATAAAGQCTAAGVPEGPQFDDCVLDVVVTSSQVFAQAASTVTAPIADGQDAPVDATGRLAWDFEGTLPRNVLPTRLSTGSTATRFAGPFGNAETYGFNVAQLAAHSRATVTFDVLVVGDWGSDADDETVRLALNGTQVWSANRAALGTPTASGTMPNGAPWTRHRVVVAVDHIDPALRASVSAVNVNSLAAQGYGIDNVTVALTLQPPQTFPATLPLTVTNGRVNGASATGAGNLESRASTDVYRVSLPAAGKLLVDLTACPGPKYTHWDLVNEATGASVADGGCLTEVTPTLPAGAYRLVLKPGFSPTAGTYSLSVVVVPAPQEFAATVPLTVTDGSVNGAAAAGAGNLETKASTDVYRFTVPAGGQTLTVGPGPCPGPSGGFLQWRLVDDASGAEVTTGGCRAESLGTLPAGTYRLEVTPFFWLPGTYTLNVQPSQVFTTAVPLTVASGTVNGATAAGAGSLETKASEDVYRFTVPAGGQVLNAAPGNCPTSLLTWELVSEGTGASLAGGDGPCRFTALGTVPAGSYRLMVRPFGGQSGTYTFAIQPPQTFTTAVPLTVGNGTVNGATAAGAGNLETKASEDVYRFTVPAGGQVLNAGPANCPTSLLTWDLVSEGTGARLAGGDGPCRFTALGTLTAGTYQVRVRPFEAQSGTYTFAIQPPQTFTTAVPLTVASGTVNGAAAAGAGNLETKASEDVYRFTVPAGGQSLAVGSAGCPTGGLSWALVNDATGTVVGTRENACTFTSLGTVAAGAYRLRVYPASLTGTYTLAVQPPQVFAATLPLVVGNGTVNGAAAAGAGNLETPAAHDVYRFTVASGTHTLSVTPSACPAGLGWDLLADATAAVVRSGTCTATSVTGVAGGTYRLLVRPGSGGPGTYALTASVAA
ncbi:MAG TPA: VWD domain-containing protein [Mycobacteriales bacterium]|nr:VWD domain-containing protein [Mycobacteriales bacterium]